MAAMRLMSNYPMQLHYVVQKFGYLQNKGTFLRNSVPNCGCSRKYCHLSSTEVYIQCDKLASVVGRTRMTLDGRPTTVTCSSHSASCPSRSVYRTRHHVARVHLQQLTLVLYAVYLVHCCVNNLKQVVAVLTARDRIAAATWRTFLMLC